MKLLIAIALLASSSAHALVPGFTCSGDTDKGASLVVILENTQRGPYLRVTREESRIIYGYAVKKLDDPRGVIYTVPGEVQLLLPNMRPGDGRFQAIVTISKPGSEANAILGCRYGHSLNEAAR